MSLLLHKRRGWGTLCLPLLNLERVFYLFLLHLGVLLHLPLLQQTSSSSHSPGHPRNVQSLPLPSPVSPLAPSLLPVTTALSHDIISCILVWSVT